MRPEDHRSFAADDPVARYWLHHSVGFRVRGVGVVDAIVTDGGMTVLEVRRLGLTTRIPMVRVDSIDPWNETIVLRSRTRPPRERPHAVVTAVVTAAHAATIFTAALLRRFFALLARLLLAAAAFARQHAPGARQRAGRIASTLAAVGSAYAAEAARAYRTQAAATKAWREERRRAAWGDESAPTRAGDDKAGARRGEEDRALPSKRVGR